MIHSLTIAKQTFDNNIIQGPLAGVSCAPFRLLTSRYSQPAFTYTEMISCKTIIHQPDLALRRFMAIDPNEGPVCFQLSGNNPAEVGEAVKKVTDHGADLIDLNCGCPVKKIRSKGAGSSLLTKAPELYHLIKAMKQNTHVPVGIKIRVEGLSDEKFNQTIADVVKEAGADFLVVHGRHWTEHYETPCRHEQIQFFAQQLTIPVIGNGDVACKTSLEKMFATGCDGAMIGRAGVGQPWLIAKLKAEMNQQEFIMPLPVEIGAMFFEHVSALTQLLENEKLAILQARKFAKYYARTLKDRMELCQEINQCHDLATLNIIIQRYFI